MEVILIKDLKRRGTFGDVITVANGYAMNYLIPNQFAIPATKANQKKFSEIKKKAFASVEAQRDELKIIAADLANKTFTIVVRARDGKLYGSVSPTAISNQIISVNPDLIVNPSDIIIDAGTIKFVGTYACRAQFTKDISAKFTVVVESDSTDEEPELLESVIDKPAKKSNNVSEAAVSETDDATDDTLDDSMASDVDTLAIDDYEDLADSLS
jgi:large subunit ribosomal protein L9